MKISVVICTKDRLDDLNKTLESIGKQQYLPDEVLIVDASEDRRIEEGIDGGELILRYLHTSEAGLTRQRNLGVSNAGGDIIIFFDDDVELTPQCIGSFARSFAELPPDVVAVCGRILNVAPDLSTARKRFFYSIDCWLHKLFMMPEEAERGYFKASTASVRPHMGDEPGYTEVISGGCSGYRREVFTRLKFDEYFSAYAYAEDVEFSRQIANAGWRMYYQPAASLYHYPSSTARISRRAGSKMLVENMFYIYRKGFTAGFFRLAALFWSFSGFCLCAALHRDFDRLLGLLSGVCAVAGKLKWRDVVSS